MEQQVVLVTGASGNLGSAIVNFFLDQGNKVIGLVHSKRQSIDLHENYLEYAVNLLDEAAVVSCIDRLKMDFSRISLVVMTAGGFTMGNISNTGIEKLEGQFRLNFLTAWNIASHLHDWMVETGGGKLFFVGSTQGLDAQKGTGVVAYSLAKSLLFHLAGIINANSKDSKLTAFVLVPSIIDTPQNRQDMPGADYSKWEKPDDIAAIIGRYAHLENTPGKVIVIQSELK